MTKSKYKKEIEKSINECNSFFKNSKPSTLFEDVAKEIRKEQQKDPLNTWQSRRDRDWSILGHQVVGAENY